MCRYEYVKDQQFGCGHTDKEFGQLVNHCTKYLKSLAKFRELDRKWREGSQERCPPTPFNMFSCSDVEIATKTKLVTVPNVCWRCVDRSFSFPVQTRVPVRNWAEYTDFSYPELTPPPSPHYVDVVHDMGEGMVPTPPASSSEGDDVDDPIPEQSSAFKLEAVPRRSQRLLERQAQKTLLAEAASTNSRGRTRTKIQ